MNKRCLLLLISTLVLLGPQAARAQSSQADAQIHLKIVTGGLSIVTNGIFLDFGTVSVANVGQSVTANAVMAFTVTDSSGTGRGWNVTLQASDLTDGTGVIRATPNLRITPAGGNITATSGQPIDATNGPREVNSGSQSLGSPVRVVSANPGFGQGAYIYTPSASAISLTIPQGLQMGTGNFSGTMTATVLTGP